MKNCTLKQPPEPVYATRFFTVIGESISSSTLVKYVQQQWQGWGKKPDRLTPILPDKSPTALCNGLFLFPILIPALKYFKKLYAVA